MSRYFREQIRLIKGSGANLAICQWGFDDEAQQCPWPEPMALAHGPGPMDPLARGGEGLRVERINPCRQGKGFFNHFPMEILDFPMKIDKFI